MAAGLGTRMHSRSAEAPAPAARPPLVDWVIARGEARPAPRRRLLARTQERARAPSRSPPSSPCRSGRSARATRSRPPGRRSRAFDGDVLVVPGDTPLLTSEMLATRRGPPRVEPAVTLLSVEPAARAVRPVVRDERGAGPDRRGARRLGRGARHPGGELVDLRLRAPALWPALDGLEPHNAQGELYLTDAVRARRDGRQR